MPAVTQLTPNFLGGVSKQNDDKKLEGQLTECINGYPDPTFGLLKRPGMQYTNVLRKANGDAFTESELEDASWFFIDRATAGSYIGCIKGAAIFVWTADEGTFCTVTNTGSSYLTGTSQNDYHFRSIQDTTIITNKTVNTAMQAAGSYVAKSVGVIKLLNVDTSTYTVTLQGDAIQFAPQSTETFDDMLLYDSSDVNTNHHMMDAIRAHILARQGASDPDFTGRWYLEGYRNSLVIRRTNEATGVVTNYTAPGGTPLAFTLSARGGLINDYLESFQDEVTDVSKLPLESRQGDHVKILNSDSAEDDYYVEYVAYNGTRGDGYWKETVARDVSPGLNNATMPHELVNTGATTFTFGPITWTDRLAGDDTTNPQPSFIGSAISSTFFYSNRFGMLSQDNVILGVANDSYNFFAKSALTQVDSDPIDLNVSSVRPVTLSDVLPSPQGLLLFSERQQFQLYATDASILTPSSAVIRALSNYEMATDIAPIDVGTSPAFVSRVPGYSKLFTLQLRDVEQTPIVVDISKAVMEWIPDTVDGMSTSPPNSVIMLVDRDTSYLYIYRYYNNGKEDLFQAWSKWQLPNTIQAAKIVNDAVYVVGQHEDEYTIGKLELDELPNGNVIAETSSIDGNSCLDFATRPVKPDPAVDAVVYDETNDITKIYVPFTPIQDKEGAMLLTVPSADSGTDDELASDQGYWAAATERTEIGTGFRYFEVKGDFSGYADGIVVGYNYDFEATLPKFYFRRKEATTDYTATLTISRVKFSIGKTGAVTFKIKAAGANDWSNIQHTAEANYYSGDTNPVVSERVFTVPVHRRNTNFELKVTSNYPYPVSLVSMMWEGNYSPRFYRRT
jgi:hypothetical protein